MTKETLTLDGIRKDLLKIVSEQMSNKEDWRLSFIAPIALLAIFFGILFKDIFIGLLIFSCSGYQIYRYAKEIADCVKKKKMLSLALARGDISISTETLSHIAEEAVLEPRVVARHRRSVKFIKVYYFEGGSSWRTILVDKHYSWSREHHITQWGLENISVKGNEFFVVRLQQHQNISYIYPCKLFELDESLKK